MMRRTIYIALAILFAAVALCRPATAQDDSPEKAGKKLTVKVFELPDPKSTSVSARADRAVVNAFLKKYPDIDVRSYSGITIQGQSMDSKPLLAIAGKMAPDILYVNFRMSDTYIRNNLLAPIDEYLKQVPEDELKLRIPPPVWPVIKRRGPDGNMGTWAIPYGVVVRTLYYRKDLFDEVGLDPERPPRTWDELKEYAKRLTRPDKGTYGLIFARGPVEAWDWIGFLWSAGGQAVAQDENGEWRAVYNGKGGVTSLLYYTSLQTEPWPDSSGRIRYGYVCKDLDSARLWKEGKIGMRFRSIEESQLARGVDPDIIGIAPVPRGPTGMRASELNCRMMGMFSAIEGRDGFTAEEIRDAAWKYMWFYDSEEARRIRTRVFVESGYGRLFNPIYLKRYGYDEYVELVPKEWIEVWEEALQEGQPEPYGKNCQLVYEFMTHPLAEVMDLQMHGEMPEDEAEQRAVVQEILDRNVERTNEEMIGIITTEERARRNRVAAIVGTIMVAIFFFVLYRVWKTFSPPEAEVHGGWGFRRYYKAYLILLPALLSVLLWKYVPMGMGTAMVFQDYQLVGASKWIGLSNLGDVLWDKVWWQALWKTFYYMVLMLGLGFWTPIILAILLTEVSRGKVFYRTIYYLPAVLSGMLFIFLWKVLYDPSDAGVLNQVLAFFHIPSQRWLEDSNLAMACCVMPSIWAGMGPKCLIYLAALKTVPDDLYEAADLDGCGFFKKVRHITLPTLKALIIINFIGEFIRASQNTRFILVMTFGGPKEATKVAGLHIFQKAYLYLQFGSATTMAWILGCMMLGFTTIQLRRLSRMEFKTAKK